MDSSRRCDMFFPGDDRPRVQADLFLQNLPLGPQGLNRIQPDCRITRDCHAA
jgi:hypothetical protein